MHSQRYAAGRRSRQTCTGRPPAVAQLAAPRSHRPPPPAPLLPECPLHDPVYYIILLGVLLVMAVWEGIKRTLRHLHQGEQEAGGQGPQADNL